MYDHKPKGIFSLNFVLIAYVNIFVMITKLEFPQVWTLL